MPTPSVDEDMKEAINELGNALAAAMPGASASEVQRIIDSVGMVIDVKTAQFVELLADRAEALRATAA